MRDEKKMLELYEKMTDYWLANCEGTQWQGSLFDVFVMLVNSHVTNTVTLAASQAECERLRESLKWRPASEPPPFVWGGGMFSEKKLCYDRNGGYHIDFYVKSRNEWSSGNTYEGWRNLPPMPKEGENE
jgi:hypothetical protein